MRIAYYLNDGTRKIGKIEEFRRDYESGSVDPKRQAALEAKSKLHLGFAMRALAHEELRDGEREERKRDDRRQLAYRLLRVVAVGIIVAAFATILTDPEQRSYREWPEAIYLFLLGIALWTFTTLVKTSVNLSRLARMGRFRMRIYEKALPYLNEEHFKEGKREFTSEEKELVVDHMLYPWKYRQLERLRDEVSARRAR